MATREYICGALLALLLLPWVESVVTIEINIKEYTSDGKDYRGSSCEIFARSGCDPYFHICVDKPDGAFDRLMTDMKSCAYYNNRSTVIREAGRALNFVDEIGGIPLPLRINISDWQGGFLLKIVITDKDKSVIFTNTDDTIDLIEKKFLFADEPGANMVRSITVDERFSGYRGTNFIRAASSAYCPQNFYHEQSATCQRYCKPTDHDTGHYNCSNTGAKVCLDGWEDLAMNCSKPIDDCVNHNCSSASECVDKRNGYICKCFPGWTGTYCTTKIGTCGNNLCKKNEKCGTNATTGNMFCLGPDGNIGRFDPWPGGNISHAEPRSVGSFMSNNISLIAGLIAGLVFLILIIILLLAFLLARRKRKKNNNQSTNTAVDTTSTEMQVDTIPTSDDGIGPFGNPLYLANSTKITEPNHYSEMDYSKVKGPLPYKQPFDDYIDPVKSKSPGFDSPMHSKAIEAGFVPEHEPELVKKKLPAGAVPIYVNQAGHTPRYENNYSNSIRGADGDASAGGMKDGFSPMYASGMTYKGAGQFDNPAYDASLDTHELDGKFGDKKGAMNNNYYDDVLEPKL